MDKIILSEKVKSSASAANMRAVAEEFRAKKTKEEIDHATVTLIDVLERIRLRSEEGYTSVVVKFDQNCIGIPYLKNAIIELGYGITVDYRDAQTVFSISWDQEVKLTR